jgi:hypothetical protein
MIGSESVFRYRLCVEKKSLSQFEQSRVPRAKRIHSEEAYMRISIYVLALAPFFFVGCAEEPTTVTTTTTREVTTTGPAAREVVVTQAPPAVRVETQTVIPSPGYVWTPGYWRWTGTDYVWVSGSWVMPPQPTAVWVRGHWAHRTGGWVWIAGHWR